MASTIRTIQPLFSSLSQCGKSNIDYRRTAGVKVDILYLAICYALFVQSQMKAALESGRGKVGSRQSRSSLNYNRLGIICLHLWSVYDTVQPAQFSDWFSDWTVKGSEVYLQSHATFRGWLSLSLDQDNMRVRLDTGSRGEVWLTMCVTTTETGKACLASIYNACTSVVL